MAQRPIMVMGCTSDAGKSFLTTALCRHFASRGLRVAPFKAQNMSTNAAVTPDGFEIGRAQYVQALAARVPADVRMNPVLLKPKAETHSQVIVMGRYDPITTALPWLERRDRLWPIVKASLEGLIGEFDQVVIEGAGSPAEINLRASDIVNMAVALECRADVYLVADIDRGGAFAHLLGTVQFLEPEERALIRGFVLNKFRGDLALLGNAMERLEERTGIPTVAIVPLRRHALPEEDAFHHRGEPVPGHINIALLLFPYASNLDEFDPLIYAPGVAVTPIRARASLEGFDAIVLPGSTNTAASLRHLRDEGLAEEIVRAARTGAAIMGVCGGLQMLGRELRDPMRLEGGSIAGLGLLDVTTTLAVEKVTRRRSIAWDGGSIDGYEIHHGRTEPGALVEPWLPDGLGWRQGNVVGVYAHGLMDSGAYRQRFLEQLGWNGRAEDWGAAIEAAIDQVAALVKESGWASHLERSMGPSLITSARPVTFSGRKGDREMPATVVTPSPGFISIAVQDVQRSASFYERYLGATRDTFDFGPDSAVFVGWPTLALSSARRADLPGPSPETTSIQLWWRASDAQALFEQASADGISIIVEPFDGPFGRTFAMADPDGYRITVYEKDQPLFWPPKRG